MNEPMTSKHASYLTLAAPVSGTSPSFQASQVALHLTRPFFPWPPLFAEHTDTQWSPERCWGQKPSLGSPSCSRERTRQGDVSPTPGSLGEQQPLLGSLGEAKPPGSVPKVSPLPAGPWSASSLSPHPAGPPRPGPPDYSNNTTAFHTANPDFLPVGITQRQGLAPAQTTCSAVVTLGMG